MSFVVNIACDVGAGKVNTGFEFPQRPGTLSHLIHCAEKLYTTELRLHTGDESRVFQCVSCMKLVFPPGSDRAQWAEVRDITQVDQRAQLFIFDRSSPPPSKGPIPKAQFVVSEHQINQLLQQAGAAPIAAAAPNPQQAEPQPAPPSRLPAGAVNTPPAGRRAPESVSAQRAPSQRFSYTSAAASSTAPPIASRADALPSQGAVPPPRSALPAEAHAFLRDQLCRASGHSTQISAQKLHSIFVENGLVFSTEVFADITDKQPWIDEPQWQRIVVDYAPVVDALYDRIAARSVRRSKDGEMIVVSSKEVIRNIKNELLALEEEERALAARQAAIKQKMQELDRQLRDEQEEEASCTANKTADRAKEWDTLQKFVALKIRQRHLRDEDANINHQLSLL